MFGDKGVFCLQTSNNLDNHYYVMSILVGKLYCVKVQNVLLAFGQCHVT